jgi:hypothetical protein
MTDRVPVPHPQRQNAESVRIVVIRPTQGIATYMVFLPDLAGANEIGFVTHRTTGSWDFQRRDKTVCGLAYDRRKDAVKALVDEFIHEEAARD